MILNKKFYLVFTLFAFYSTSYSQIIIPDKVKQSIVVDHTTGAIFAEKNADQKISPASMTKIMTAIIVFDQLKIKKNKLTDQFVVSKKARDATKSGESSMFLVPGDKVSIEDLLKGLIVVSGVDASIVLAEGISGTEEQFVNLMNEKAKKLDMINTNFTNSSGTFNQNNYSTVRDIAKLSSYLINEYPQYYKYFKEKDFIWSRTGGNPFKQENRNVLLFMDEEVDGIKTGHLKDSKYSIAATKKKGNRRIIVVVSGLPTMSSRAESAKILLNSAFNKIDLVKLSYDKDRFRIKIWNGSSSHLDVRGANKEDIYVNLPKNLKNPKIKMELEYEYPLQLPIKKFEKVALLRIYNNKELIYTEDLLAQKDITDKNIFFKGIQNINHYIWR
ncbi:MAG: D-alanyl-D-alanine carboxypeptidase [Candidatus Fonsibacter sp.]|nr:D-alanyl-D-alanine carboxypeptidase [Candidatus Fonsibacter sp.]